MTGDALVIQGDALNLALPDESVDLIITSPPYFALRSYRDDGTHYAGQIGSEETPQAFLEALWAATREMVRVLKPTGSIWVNLGDKYAGSGGHNNSGISDKSTLRGNGHTGGVGKAGPQKIKSTLRSAPDRYNQNADGIRAKSLMGLPWRYAIGCIDDLGLILRAEVIWNKPNGLPESVTDRVRRSHEQWFMFTKEPQYFAAVDEVRESHQNRPFSGEKIRHHESPTHGAWAAGASGFGSNPLGKLPGSVWTIPSEPLMVPEWARTKYNLPDHFAAFCQEWPRRIILGWSPSGVCVECGEGRMPVVDKRYEKVRGESVIGARKGLYNGGRNSGAPVLSTEATITGYACACTPYTDHPGTGEKSPIPSGTDEGGRHRTPTMSQFAVGERGGRVGPHREYHLDDWTPPETKPAVVLDPFGGTGTVAMVARALGRTGISVDLSMDYSRLAKWRIESSGHASKTLRRTWTERQTSLM